MGVNRNGTATTVCAANVNHIRRTTVAQVRSVYANVTNARTAQKNGKRSNEQNQERTVQPAMVTTCGSNQRAVRVKMRMWQFRVYGRTCATTNNRNVGLIWAR